MEIVQVGIKMQKKSGFSVNRLHNTKHVFQLFYTRTMFTIQNQDIAMPKNTVILFHQDSPQKFHNIDINMQNSYFCFTATEEEVRDLPFDIPFVVNNPKEYELLLSLFDEELKNNCNAATTNILFHFFFERIKQDYANRPIQPPDTSIGILTLHQLRKEINYSLEKEWTVEQMAKRAGMSISGLQHRYKETFGISPMADLIKSRVIHSIGMLLDGNSSIAAIAEYCGFHNTENYIRQFKKEFGTSPRQYRKTHQSK